MELEKGLGIVWLREKSLTNTDRFDLVYRRYSVKNKGVTKDDLLGLLLAGKVSFLDEQMS